MTDTDIKIDSISTQETLQKAYDGSWYFIAGAGGDLTAWVKGYGDLLDAAEIARPTQWFQATGAAVNALAGSGVVADNLFPLDVTCLLFPLDGMHLGRLAIFKIRMGDRWFDDVINNMRPGGV